MRRVRANQHSSGDSVRDPSDRLHGTQVRVHRGTVSPQWSVHLAVRQQVAAPQRKATVVTTFIGIDPGANGGIGVLRSDGAAFVYKLPKTNRDIYDLLDEIRDRDLSFPCACCIEAVGHFLPRQFPAHSAVRLGKSYGFLLGCLTAIGIPYREVQPSKWQKRLACQTKGDKKKTYALAQQLYPKLSSSPSSSPKITHATADAILIARYCSLTWE